MKKWIPIWWLTIAAILLFLIYLTISDDSQYREYVFKEHAEVENSKFENLVAFYSESLLTGIEGTLYYYVGTIMLLGVPTILGIIIYACMKKFQRVAGLAIGFVVFLLFQLGLEIWFTYPKPIVTDEHRKAVEAKAIQDRLDRESALKRERKYPRALPGGGLDWTDVKGGPR